MKQPKNLQTLDALQKDIFQGYFAPGDKLLTVELMQRYKVSASTLREALSRLSVNGLISETPQCGYKVASISVEELRDIYKVRAFILHGFSHLIIDPEVTRYYSLQ